MRNYQGLAQYQQQLVPCFNTLKEAVWPYCMGDDTLATALTQALINRWLYDWDLNQSFQDLQDNS